MTNRARFPYLFSDVPPGALFEHAGELFTRQGSTLNGRTLATRTRRKFKPMDLCNMSEGEARGAARAPVVLVGSSEEPAPYREQWTRHNPGGSVTACRFMVFWRGRWRRLFSDHAPGLAVPHFLNCDGWRVPVQGVAP